MNCKSVEGAECEIPFKYHGKYYDSCINVDNGGTPWCYDSNESISDGESQKEWGICTIETCPTMKGKEMVCFLRNTKLILMNFMIKFQII